MLKGNLFPWKWTDPPNEKQLAVIVAGATAIGWLFILLLPRWT